LVEAIEDAPQRPTTFNQSQPTRNNSKTSSSGSRSDADPGAPFCPIKDKKMFSSIIQDTPKEMEDFVLRGIFHGEHYIAKGTSGHFEERLRRMKSKSYKQDVNGKRAWQYSFANSTV
jgi:hypothetical protein